MPVTLSYPGVYIEEVSSGVRTITGVATSITAFIGRALRGPVEDKEIRCACRVSLNIERAFRRSVARQYPKLRGAAIFPERRHRCS